MENRQITESELFKKLNILLLSKNKDHLDEVKEKISLLSNMEIDNSGFVRGVIEYYFDNPAKLEDLVPYVTEYKGYNILDKLEKLIEKNKTIKEIDKETGIGTDILKRVLENK